MPKYFAGFFLLAALCGAHAAENSARWIWSNEAAAPAADTRYFRKAFGIGQVPPRAVLTISCDNNYELYVNDTLVGTGNEWKAPGVYDAARFLRVGTNVIAVKAANLTPGTAGLLLDFDGGGAFHVFTGADWHWYEKEVANWLSGTFAETSWKPVKDLGDSGALPWKMRGWPRVVVDKDELTAGHGNFPGGFQIPPGFVLDNYAEDRDTSSALCMTFNARGQLLIGAAGSGVTEVRMLEDGGGYCSGHHLYYPGLHCQGLCAVGNDIYAVGNGRLYLLKDVGGRADNQEPVSALVLGSMEEHGPHGIVHGPDGRLYIVLGNNSTLEMKHMAPTSPIKEEHLYWGNLLPILSSGGFMDGRGPPGGRIVRTDLKGKAWETVAANMRNVYDFTFSPAGEIFSFDSDMEWDIGLPWYRPNRTMHVPIGANFGWRFGSGKWKSWTPDNLPPMKDVGRGSPTGIETYSHVAFPEEYRDAIFFCDWSRGRVLVSKPVRDGATWKADVSEFIAAKGTSFPVTDCCVGPDGALYFCYGGRGAKGGVFRVRYVGDRPMRSVFQFNDLKGLPESLALALNTPQYLSAFGRASIKRSLERLGPATTKLLSELIYDTRRPDALRSRALDFLAMDGEFVDMELLQNLCKDQSALMRAQAVRLSSTNCQGMMTTPPPGPGAHIIKAYVPLELLRDKDPWVQRRCCEALLSHPNAEALKDLLALLGHSDRFLRFAASQALLRFPHEFWAPKIMALDTPLARCEGLLTWAQSYQSLKPDPQSIAPHFELMLAFGSGLLDSKMNPEETLTALRAVGLTLLARADNGAIPPIAKLRLRSLCAGMLDNADARVCMDAAEVLSYLNDARSIAALLAKLKNDLLPRDERIHYAVCAGAIGTGWEEKNAAELLEFLAAPGAGEDGASFQGALTQTAARLVKTLTPEQRTAAFNLLTPGAKTFTAAVQGVNVITAQGYAERFQKAASLAEKTDLLSKLASLGNDEAFRALEKLSDETSPLYDAELTQLMRFKHADAKKYAVLALASPSRGLADAALERVQQLYKEDPEDPNMYYGLIVCAARSNESRESALALLKKWAIDDKALAKLPPEADKQIAYWQQIFRETFKQDKHAFPDFSGEGWQNPEKYAKLMEYIKANPGGSAEAGKTFFTTTGRCVNCHAFKGEGKQLGPELTDVAKRFERAKILEDIVYPSKVVDARYRQTLFTMKDGQRVSGFGSAETDDSLSVTNSDAVTVSLKKAEIVSKKVTELSIMPNGLLDTLTPEQIRDLLAFLETGK